MYRLLFVAALLLCGAAAYANDLAALKEKAASGDAEAQLNLGRMYATGEGVLEDNILAYLWLNLAGAQGIKFAREAKEKIVSRMTTEQIAEAQRLSPRLVWLVSKCQSWQRNSPRISCFATI